MKFPKGAIEISGTLILFVIIVGATMAAIYGYFNTHNAYDCSGRTDVLIKDLETRFSTFDAGTTTGKSTIEGWKTPSCVVCAYVDRGADEDEADDDVLRFELEGEEDDRLLPIPGYSVSPDGDSCTESVLLSGKTYNIVVSKVNEDSINADDPLKIEFNVV